MDILRILHESGKDLIPEDLDMLEMELATGGTYDAPYQRQCLILIKELRAWIAGGRKRPEVDLPSGEPEKAPEKPKHGGVAVSLSELSPLDNGPAADRDPAELIRLDIASMRDVDGGKTEFKKYVAARPEIDAAFIDAHYSFFRSWELDAMLSVRQMGEEFLEKYFGALDHGKIARYQQFSESFFMKHFVQLSADIVLKYGKNEWRKKEKRSKQLDVFLRLKGISF